MLVLVKSWQCLLREGFQLRVHLRGIGRCLEKLDGLFVILVHLRDIGLIKSGGGGLGLQALDGRLVCEVGSIGYFDTHVFGDSLQLVVRHGVVVDHLLREGLDPGIAGLTQGELGCLNFGEIAFDRIFDELLRSRVIRQSDAEVRREQEGH